MLNNQKDKDTTYLPHFLCISGVPYWLVLCAICKRNTHTRFPELWFDAFFLVKNMCESTFLGRTNSAARTDSLLICQLDSKQGYAISWSIFLAIITNYSLNLAINKSAYVIKWIHALPDIFIIKEIDMLSISIMFPLIGNWSKVLT